MARLTRTVLVLPLSFGLKLPALGVFTDHHITVSTTAVDGPVSPMRIEAVPTVGAFSATSLSYAPQNADGKVRITFKFTPHMPLSIADTITIHLPGFYYKCTGEAVHGCDLTTPIVGNTDYSSPEYSVQKLSWNSIHEALTFTVARKISAGALAIVQVPRSFVVDGVDGSCPCGIALPVDGLERHAKNLTVMTNAVNGPFMAKSIESSLAVGSFLQSELILEPAIAGNEADITLRLQASMVLNSGFRLKIRLPGFATTEQTLGAEFTVSSSPSGYFEQASWSDYDKITALGPEISFLIFNAVPARMTVDITISRSYGIKVPMEGLEANQVTLQISTDNKGAPVRWRPILSSPPVSPVGYFGISKISFTNPYAGNITDIKIRFSVFGAVLFPGDLIKLQLPGFTGDAVNLDNQGTLSDPADAVQSITWHPDSEEMIVSMARDIVLNEIIEVFFPVTARVALPRGGVTRNQSTVTIRCAGRAGVIETTRLLDTPYVDSLISSANMFFYPAHSGAPVNIGLSFTTQVHLQEGEELTLLLPEFGDGATAIALPVTTRPLGMFAPTAAWNPVQFLLTLVVQQDINAGVSLNVTIFKDSALTLAEKGLSKSGPDVLLKTASIPFHPIRSIDAVGTFENSALNFSASMAGMPTGVALRFTLMMNIAVGEAITVQLPDFAGALNTISECSSSSVCFNAAWSPTTSRLEIRFDEVLASGQAVHITLPESFGLNLPADGVTLNQMSLTLSTGAKDGQVNDQSFASVAQVGIFYLTPAVEFVPEYTPGEFSEITVKDLAFSSAFKPGQLITLKLTGLVSAPFETLQLRASTGHLFYASWSPDCPAETLILAKGYEEEKCPGDQYQTRAQCEQNDAFDIPAKTSFDIKIRSKPMQVPVEGLPKQTVIYVGVTTSGGASATVVAHFNPIAAMVSQFPLGIGFLNRLAFGQPTDLTFKFGMQTGFLLYDQVDLTLPGFDNGGQNFLVEGQDGANFVGMWMGAGHLRFYYIGYAVNTYREYSLLVPQSSGIKIPFKGVKGQGHGMVVALDTQNGKESEHSIKNVQPVGSFRDTCRVAFEPAIANENTSITLTCVGEMNLVTGDNVTIYLPSFTLSANATSTMEVTVSGAFAYAYWHNTQMVTLPIPITIPRHSPLQIMILLTQGIRLPKEGVVKDAQGIKLKVDAEAGSVPPTSVRVQGVGALSQTNLSFSFDRLDSPAHITFTFQASMDIRRHDIVELYLVDFNLTNTVVQFSVESSPPSVFSFATWNDVKKSLSLEFNQSITAESLVSATIPSSAGIRLPERGVMVKTMSKYSVGGNFLLGIVIPKTFAYIQPVGSLTDTTEMDFTPGKAGVENTLLIKFAPSMDMLVGERVTIRLPGFSGENVVARKDVLPPKGSLGEYLWNNALKELSIFVVSFVAQGTPLNVSVALILPAQGVRTNQESIRIATNSYQGAVRDSSFASVQPIGSLLGSTSLQLDPMLAGATTIVTLTFKTQMALNPGDILQLVLPLFGRATNVPLSASLKVVEKVLDSTVFSNITKQRNVTETRNEAQPELTNGTLQCRIVPTSRIMTQDFTVLENVFVEGPQYTRSENLAVTDNTQNVMMEIPISVPADTAERTVDITVAIAGLTAPSTGLRPNQADLKYAVTAVDGSILLTAIDTSPSVGAFLEKRLSFRPGKASTPAALTVEVTTVMALEQGDEIVLSLPGFTTHPSVPSTVLNVQAFSFSSNKVQFASWNPMDKVMTFVLADDVSAGQLIAINLPLTMQFGAITFSLVLPKVGVRAYGNGISISTNAAAGRVSGQPMTVMPVGSFTDTANVSYSPPLAGSISEISVSLAPENGISYKDILVITLPTFEQKRDASISFSVTSYPDGLFTSGRWTASASSVAMTCQTSKLGKSRITVTIGVSAQIKLPVDGLTRNQASLGITIISSVENIPITPITESPAVGSFLQSPYLQYAPLKVNMPLEITLSARAQMDISMGEYIFVSLPSFGGSSQVKFDLSTNVKWRTYWSGSQTMTLSNVSTGHALATIAIPPYTLALVAKARVLRATPISVSVPSSAGIVLPAIGTFANQTSWTISTNADAGPVLPTAISQSPAVGSFVDSSYLKFPLPCRPLQQCALEFGFNQTMGFGVYDRIEIYLPGYTGPGWLGGVVRPKLWVDGVQQRQTVIEWRPVNKTLSVKIMNLVASNARMFLEIPSGAGLVVPRDGLRLNEQLVTISTNASLGPVLGTSITNVQGVGAFLQSPHLSFPGPAVAAKLTKIRLMFEGKMAFVPGDTVTLKLTGFTSNLLNIVGSQYANSTSPVGAFAFHSWSSAREELIFECHRPVRAETTVDITVLSSVGIRLPSAGVQRNQQDITIATDTVQGPVLPIAVYKVDPVGSFMQSTSIAFSISRADTVSAIIVRFVAQMTLNVSDSVFISLGGFTVPLGKNTSIGLVHVTNEAGGIRFRPLASIAAGQEVLITVPTSFGITIPVSGAGHSECCIATLARPGGECCIRIHADAEAGSILSEPVANVRKIGSFAEVSLDYSPPRVGSVDSILLQFIPSMDIQEGEQVILLPVFACDSDGCGRLVVNTTSYVNTTSNISVYNETYTETYAYAISALKQDDYNKTMFAVQWKNSTSQLVMTSLLNIASGQKVAVNVRAPFVMSTAGTPSNNEELTYSTNAVAGVISSTEIPYSPGILSKGILSYSQIGYNPASAGANTEVLLEFMSLMTLYPGSNLTLKLPGFTKGLQSQPIFSRRWHIMFGQSDVVVVHLRALTRIEANTLEQVSLPRLLGVKLPDVGLQANTTDLTLASDSPSGPMPDVAIQNSPAVGSFVERLPPMSFGTPIADTATDLYVNMTPTMKIVEGESFSMSLPYFTRDASGMVNETMVSPSGYFRNVAWQTLKNNQTRLTFDANQDIAASTTIHWSISSAAGIRLPVSGVRKQSSGITVSVMAQSGQVQDVSMTIVHPVGSFVSREDNQYARLSFKPASAGKLTNITLSITPQMRIAAGESVTIRLPGFGLLDKASSSRAVQSVPSGKISTIGLSNSSDFNPTNVTQIVPGVQVIVVLHEDIIQDQTVLVYISGTSLPMDGVRANSPYFTIASNALEGKVLTSPISISQSVGAFSLTNVTFDEFVKAGTVTSVTLRFEAEMLLESGDMVSLLLTDFKGPAGAAAFAVESYPRNSIGPASWNAMASQIIFAVNHTILPRTHIEVTVPLAVGMFLPVMGIRSVTETVQISSTAKSGLVPSTVIEDVQPIGYFSDTEITFQSLAKASNVSFIQIAFTPLMRLMQDEMMAVELPGFEFPDKSVNVTWPLQGNMMTLATWVSDTESLRLKLPLDVSANTRCIILIPASSGALLPYVGVRVNDPKIQLSTTAVHGPSPSSPILRSQPVGSFTDSTQLRFSVEGFGEGRVNSLVSIWLYFKPKMTLQKGDHLSLKLPGFKGPASRALVIQSHVLDSNNGRPSLFISWSQMSSILVLTLQQQVVANKEFIALIPTEMGISLPLLGLRANQKELTISTDAALGPVPPTTFVKTPAVGYFERTRLSFQPTCDLSMGTGLRVEFQLVTDLAQGDRVTIKLPGFGFTNTGSSAVPMTSLPADAMSRFASYIVSPGNLQLVFRVEQSLSALTKILVEVASGEGVMLPSSGVTKNDLAMLMSTNAESGPVPPTPIYNVSAVGAFFTAQMEFDKPCPGRPATFSLTIQTEMQLEANDRIFLNFTGFGSNSISDSQAVQLLDSSENKYISKGTVRWWPNNAGGTVELVVRTTVVKGITWKTGRVGMNLVLPGGTGSYSVSVRAQAQSGNSCPMLVVLQDLSCPKLTPADVILETKLDYREPKASSISPLNLTFNLAFALVVGDNMTLSLPGFFTKSEEVVLGWLKPPCTKTVGNSSYETNRLCVEMQWVSTGQYGGHVKMRALGTMLEGQVGWLEIPQNLMIRLPRTGLEKDQQDLTLTVHTDKDPALDAVVEYTRSIVESPPVGYFYYTEVEFYPRVAGQAVQLTLTIDFIRALYHGDTISLYLEKFGGPSKEGILALSSELTLRGRWDSYATILHLTVDQPGRALASRTKVSVTVAQDAGITMPDETVLVPSCLIQTNAVEGPVKFTSILHAKGVIKYRCLESVITMPDDHICQGNNTVRVCAGNQQDADMWTRLYATPALAAVNPASCEEWGQDTCKAGLADGGFSGPDKDKCCRVRGVNQLAMCSSDQECKVTSDLGHYQVDAIDGIAEVKVPRIPLSFQQPSTDHAEIREQCCDYCESVLGSQGNALLSPPIKPFCNGADLTAAKQKCKDMGCKTPAPANSEGCIGFTFGSVEKLVDSAVGGLVGTPEGAAMDIPPDVWPADAGVASVSIISNPPAPPKGAASVGSAVFFGPSGTVFPEPGVKMALPFDDSAVSADTNAALEDGSMEFKVHKLVNGVFVPHPFPPVIVVDPLTGIKTMSVKTLGFSVYMTLIVPVQRTTPATVHNITAAPRQTPRPAPLLRPETNPARPTPAPIEDAKPDIVAIVGASIGGVIAICFLGTAVYVYRERYLDQRRTGSKSKQLRGTITESLLSGGAVVSASDSSATQSHDTTPPGTGRMMLTKAQQKDLRPPAFEVSTSLVLQSDLIMADGSNPPSYAPSEIDREEVEERILEGGGNVYPRPQLDSEFVTVQADLMLIDTFDSPAPSYAPSMADDFDDDDERAPGQISFRFSPSTGGEKLPARPNLEPAPSISFAPERPSLNGPSRPNINVSSVQDQDDLMGQDLAARPRMSMDVGGQDDII